MSSVIFARLKINKAAMIISRKSSQVNVFAGSPWEAASVKSLLNAAYIDVSTEDKKDGILLSVPAEYYAVAIRIIGSRA